jgi:membrane associated rhomboid family serine protease
VRPPPLSHLLYYPVTAHIGAAALSLSLAKFGGVDLSFLYTDYHTWPRQPWRLLTSALLHANFIHLAFNLYWFWMFGSIIEGKLGALRTAAIYLMLAFGSSAAEFAVFRGGVGLSGVVYGQFALIWLLNRRDPRFGSPNDVIDYQTSAMMVFWFFLCIVLTVTNIMPIANVAHGSGALLGYLLAWAMSARSRQWRVAWWAGLVACLALFTAASWWGRPYVNLSRNSDIDFFYAAKDAIDAGRPEEAIDLLHQALHYNSRRPESWHNLGVAYYRLGRVAEAEAAFQRERQLQPRQRAPQ